MYCKKKIFELSVGNVVAMSSGSYAVIEHIDEEEYGKYRVMLRQEDGGIIKMMTANEELNLKQGEIAEIEYPDWVKNIVEKLRNKS